MRYLPTAKRNKLIRALASALSAAMLCLSATAISGQTKPTHEKPGWNDKLIPGSQLTVLDLARRIVPDIKSRAGKTDEFTATDLSGIRMLDGVEPTGMELDPDSHDQSEITDADYFWMKDGGDKLLVLLLKVKVEGVVIGLFNVSPEVGLADAVTIAQDIHVDVNGEELWTIHSQHQAFSVHCWHDNSSESFDSYTFVSIIDRKLRAVAGPIASFGSVTNSTAQRLCKTATTPEFRFVKSQGAGYFDLTVTEKTIKVCHRESEEWSWKTGIVSTNSVRRLWTWNAKNHSYRKASTLR